MSNWNFKMRTAQETEINRKAIDCYAALPRQSLSLYQNMVGCEKKSCLKWNSLIVFALLKKNEGFYVGNSPTWILMDKIAGSISKKNKKMCLSGLNNDMSQSWVPCWS